MRTKYDLEMLRETGFCNGVKIIKTSHPAQTGEPPYTLIDYFLRIFCLSLMSPMLPFSSEACMQVTGQKETLVKYGFRLPSALDNPWFEEFEQR